MKKTVQPDIDALKANKQTASDIYVALIGINYGEPERRVEAGDEIQDLTEDQIRDLFAIKAIRPKEGDE